jgi:Subtilase family
VDAGIVVVSAAGNMGKNAAGQIQYGAITAPGNAPWVLTVGASSTQGTPTRDDDVIGDYSSRGPTKIDYSAKPDLVAPGTGTVSLAAPGSNFYQNKPGNLVAGLTATAFTPYLTLTGTSMAAPVVAGTVALMVQANPALTPNGIKAILQYTAQVYPGYNGLTQGAGFLNTLGAVRLARFYATGSLGDKIPVQKIWSKHILWGNHMLKRGVPVPTTNAFRLGVVWGAATTDAGDNIVWGSQCATDDCDNIVWGSAADTDNIVWGSSVTGDNIVWGSGVAGDDDNIVWGSDCGGGDCDNIVWGSFDAADNIVWGSAAPGDNIVWGSNALNDDNIVWGSSGDDSDNIVWGSSADDNIVWASSADDNIVWGSSAADDNIVWGSDASGVAVWVDLTTGTGGTVSTNSHMEKLTDAQLLKLIIGTAAHIPPPTLNQTFSSLLGGI